MKKDAAYNVLRVGMAITFLWVGVLIFKEPELWGGFIKPWAAALLPVSATQAMMGTAVLDILVGLFLLIDAFTWIAALVGAIHLLIVLTVSGIDFVTVRDIGLLGACISLVFSSVPETLKAKFRKNAMKV